MANILRGKRKGQTVEVHQWCNDWVMADGEIFAVTQLQFTEEEFQRIKDHNNNGTLFREFEPDLVKRTFKRRR